MKTVKAMKAMKSKPMKAMKQAKPMKAMKSKVKPRTVRKTVQKSGNPNGEFGKFPAKLNAVNGKTMPAFGMWDGESVRPYNLKLAKMKPLDLVVVGPPKNGC